MLIAQAAASAFGDECTRAGMREIGEKDFRLSFTGSVDERADRNGDGQVLTAAAGFVRRSARFARFGRKRAPKAKLDERGKLGRGFEVDAAAVPAIAAGRPSLGDVLLAPPGNDAVTAIPGGNRDLYLVNELQRAFG